MLRNDLTLKFGQEYDTAAGNLGTNQYDIGQKMRLPDGRTFRFGQVGGVTLVAGTLQQGAVPVANHVGQTIATATAVNATALAVTLGATSLDFGQYDSGVVTLPDGRGTGAGFSYPIARSTLNGNINPNAAASAAVSVALQTGYKLQAATNTSDKVTLISSPWKNVVIAAIATTSMPCGVALTAATTAGTINATSGNAYNVALGQFCWLQTGGLSTIRADSSTLVVGQGVTPSTATAGDVGVATATPLLGPGFIGWSQAISSSAGFASVFLLLDI